MIPQISTRVLAVLALTASVSSTLAGRGVIVDADGMLWDVDLTNGQYSNPRLTNVPGCTGCLALGGSGAALETDGDGTLYGVSRNVLYRVDEQTGDTDFVGSVRYSSFYPGGMAWDPATETMFTSYISLGGGSTRALLDINLNSGQLNLLTGIRINRGGVAGLAIDTSGDLFALSAYFEAGEGVTDTISQVDKRNGEFLWTRDLSQDIFVGGPSSMDFDPDTNQMYIASTPGFGIPPSLYTINVQTGVVNLIGSESEFIYPMSLVILPGSSIPEPSTIALGAAVAMLVAFPSRGKKVRTERDP